MSEKPRRSVTALAMSAAMLVALVSYESYTGTAIIPVPGDVPTIGFGTTRRPDGTPVKMGDTIAPHVALARALSDVNKFEGALRQCVKVPLSQNEYDAFISLSYNIGSQAFCGSTLVRKLNARDYAGACAEISRWNRQGGKVLQGLVNRREKERALCEGRM